MRLMILWFLASAANSTFFFLAINMQNNVILLIASVILFVSCDRSLPPLAKKYVLQLLYIDSPIAAKSIEEWVLADGSTKHKVAIDRLVQLRVLSETFDRLVTLQLFVNVFLSILENSLVNKE